MKQIKGGVGAPRRYRASGVAAGIKAGSSKKDCALIVSDTPATVTGMFTKNVMKAPPVIWNVDRCRGAASRVVFINSGNANAATGEQGHRDVASTAELVGKGLGLAAAEVCICSTGVIGVPLPMDRIARGVGASIEALSPGGSGDAAEAIMTTDTVPKEGAVELALSQGTVRLGAIAKGSGMISPDMATMIAVLTTDAGIDAAALDGLMRDAVDASFHRICVDNDMSTSDTVLVFANGASGVSLAPGTKDCEAFGAALTLLCQDMAKALVRDGEGASKFVEIAVTGAADDDDARTIARAIGNSQLCKTAFFGEDPNWGRFACAAGYAGVDFDPAGLDIWLEDVQVARGGLAAGFREEDAAAIMQRPEFRVKVSVGKGAGQALFWTCDLGHDYVSINADYRS